MLRLRWTLQIAQSIWARSRLAAVQKFTPESVELNVSFRLPGPTCSPPRRMTGIRPVYRVDTTGPLPPFQPCRTEVRFQAQRYDQPRNGSAPKDLPRPAYQSLIRPLGLIRSSPLARFHAPPGTRLRAFRRSDGAIQVRDQISATSDGPSRFLAQRGKSPVRQNCCLHKMDARLGISRDALYREWACRRSAILGGPAPTGNANHDAASYSRVAQIGRPLTVLSGKRVVSTGPS